jgi:hypothetical protein
VWFTEWYDLQTNDGVQVRHSRCHGPCGRGAGSGDRPTPEGEVRQRFDGALADVPNGLLLIQLNAMNPQFWRDLKDCFETADQDSDVRAVVLTGGESRIFTAGLDLAESFASAPKDVDENGAKIDVARKTLRMHSEISTPQESVNAVERCRKPVVIALHSGVVGGGIDLACAADIRYCTEDSFFSIAEVKVGLAADLGTLQVSKKGTTGHSGQPTLAHSSFGHRGSPKSWATTLLCGNWRTRAAV